MFWTFGKPKVLLLKPNGDEGRGAFVGKALSILLFSGVVGLTSFGFLVGSTALLGKHPTVG